MDVGVEFHSLSKTYSMTGWRIGFCVTATRATWRGLGKIKTNVDSGVFQAVQEAGIAAAHGTAGHLRSSTAAIYQERRDVVVAGPQGARLGSGRPRRLLRLGAGPRAIGLARLRLARLLDEVGCVVTPGRGLRPVRRRISIGSR